MDQALSEAEKFVEESNRIQRNRIEVQQLEAKLLRFVVGRTPGRDGPSPPIHIRRDGVGGAWGPGRDLAVPEIFGNRLFIGDGGSAPPARPPAPAGRSRQREEGAYKTSVLDF